MNRLLTFLLAILVFAGPLRAAEKRHYVLYGMLIAETRVEMADGSRWIMDKGDTFPVMMFKEHQTKVALQLAGTSFITDIGGVKIIEEKDITPEQLATYRTNVQHYIDNRAEKWKAEQEKK